MAVSRTDLDESDPYLTGCYEPVDDERDDELTVRGSVPEGLRGTFMRNGPNPQFPPLGRYHVFDGDGMIHAIRLEDGRAGYSNRWIASAGLLAERAAGRARFGGLSAPVLPDGDLLEQVGMFKNTANTNIIRHAGRYLALMEAGPPTELTGDLDTVGEFDFDGRLRGPMTAHPRVDPSTGEMHFFGYSPFPPHLRYHVAGSDGRLHTSVDVDLPRATMMHDFVITQRYAVFFDLPAVFDLDAMLAGGAGIRWQPEHGARIGLLDRHASDDPVRWIEIEPCYVFHFFNAYDDADGTVVVDGCRAPAMPTAFGDEAPPGDDVFPSVHRWRIDPGASATTMERLSDAPTDFPRINDRFTGLPYRYGYSAHVADWTDHGVVFDGVTRTDFASGASDSFRYGRRSASGEPVFAPDPSSDDERAGWLLNYVTDLDDASTSFVILDARDLDGGPVAEIPLPRRVPFGFHGNWMPAIDT